MKLDIFYNSLVREPEPNQNAVMIEIEDQKDVIQAVHRFRSSRNFYSSYVTRTILQVLIAAVTLVWLSLSGLSVVLEVGGFKCVKTACNSRINYDINP